MNSTFISYCQVEESLLSWLKNYYNFLPHIGKVKM
jgi:hypothetical protein